MNRLIIGMLAATLAVAACAGAPGTSPGIGGSPGTGGDAALTALCGTGDASLDSISTQLEGITDTTDVTPVSQSIGTAMSNLEDVEVDAGATTLRDAAVAALQQLQTVINDPASRQQAATQAATALRTLDTQLCA